MSIRQHTAKRRVESSMPAFDPFYDQVSVLTTFDNGFMDEKGVVWEPRSTARIVTTNQSQLVRSGSGALQLDNTANSWVYSADNSAFTLSGDFTVEMWVYPQALTGTFQILFINSADTGTPSNGMAIYLGNNTYNVSVADYTLSTPAAIINGTTVTPNGWNHIAVSRTGSSIRLFINGVQSGIVTNTNTFTASNVGLGAAVTGVAGNGSRRFNGLIDGFRITQGVGRYTANFTPPTVFSNRFFEDTNDILTTIHLNFQNEALGTAAPTDSWGSLWSSNGSSSNISNLQSIFGNCYRFTAGTINLGLTNQSGVSNYNRYRIDSSVESMILEAWVYPTVFTSHMINLNGTNYPRLFMAESSTTGRLAYAFGLNTSGQPIFVYHDSAGNAQSIVAGNSVVPNQWSHIAVSKMGSSLRLHVNGVALVSTVPLSWGHSQFITSLNGFSIGGPPGNPLGGGSETYVDEIRFIRSHIILDTDNLILQSFNRRSPNTVVDRFYENVTVLNYFNGSNGVTTFPNEKYSVHERFWNFATGASISNTSPLSGTGSLSLNGTSGRLFSSRSENLGFGSGDFTIEVWVNPNDATGDECVFDCRHDSQTGFALYSSVSSGTGANRWGYATNTDVVAFGGNLTAGVWSHLAIVRQSGTVRGYLNGQLQFTVVDDRTLSLAPRYVVGQAANLSQWFAGRIDSLRVTKGIARYPSASINQFVFIPPYTYPNRGNLSDPLQRFVTCDIDFGTQSGLISDKSSRVQWALNGDAKVENGKLFADGNGDFISSDILDDSLFGFPGDFTVEMIMKPDSLTTTRTKSIFVNTHDATSGSPGISFYIPTGSLDVSWFSYPGYIDVARSSNSLNLSHDNHVAVTRRGSNVYVFINGILSPNAIGTNSTNWSVGSQVRFMTNAGGDNSVNGSARSLKITRGVARYTSNFRPPLERIDPFIDNVTALLHFQASNASTRITDRNGRLWTVNGNAQITSSNPRFGFGSLLLDGNGDWVETPIDTNSFSFGGDFTVEMWVRPAGGTVNNTKCLFINCPPAAAQSGIALMMNTNRTLALFNYQTTTQLNIGTTPLQADVWSHVAVCRSGNTTRIFINGVLDGSTTAVSATLTNSGPVRIGATGGAGNEAWSFGGQIAEVRVTRGIARYTGNFQAPTGMFPDI